MTAILQNENFFLILIIFIGLLVVARQLFLLLKISQSKNWNETEGEIVSSKLGVIENFGEVDKSFRAKIKYQYFVDATRLESNRVYYGDKLGSSFKRRYTSLLIKYPVGKKIKVYYNPLNAKQSVLEREISIEVILTFIIGLAAAIAGFYFSDFSGFVEDLRALCKP